MTTTTVSSNEIELTGCSPEPLMAYLKALGVFRIVAEQKDKQVRASWQNDVFVLHTTLDKDALTKFFLEEYSPTPVIAPWNGGSGFYPKDNRTAISAIIESEDPRFEKYRQIIASAQQILSDIEEPGSVSKKDLKATILAECRNRLPDPALPWLDAAYVLTVDGPPKYPPLLGTGGNDGRLEFRITLCRIFCSPLGHQERAQHEEGNPHPILANCLRVLFSPM